MLNPEVLAFLQSAKQGGVKVRPPILVRFGSRVMTADRWIALDGWGWIKREGERTGNG